MEKPKIKIIIENGAVSYLCADQEIDFEVEDWDAPVISCQEKEARFKNLQRQYLFLTNP